MVLPKLIVTLCLLCDFCKVIPGGPADESGCVRVGDCITEVNGINVFRKPLAEFTRLLLGPPGSTVTLGFKRDGGVLERVILRRQRSQAVQSHPVTVSASGMQRGSALQGGSVPGNRGAKSKDWDRDTLVMATSARYSTAQSIEAARSAGSSGVESRQANVQSRLALDKLKREHAAVTEALRNAEGARDGRLHLLKFVWSMRVDYTPLTHAVQGATSSGGTMDKEEHRSVSVTLSVLTSPA